MINKILSLFFGSIRAKIIFIVVWLHAVLVLFIMGDLVTKQEKFMEKQVYAEGQNMASVLSVNAPTWLISYDVAGLNEILSGFKPIKKVKLAMILDDNLKVVASTDNSLVGINLSDSYSVELKKTIDSNPALNGAQSWHDDTIDSIHAIAINNTTIGYSRVILDASEFQEEVSKLKKDGILYVILAMIFGALIAWITVHTMTKQLVHLSEVANEVANGNLDIKILHYKGDDEVARLSNDFSKMVLQLQKGVLLSKLASLGEMIGHIAHQWRQPLSVITTIASGVIFRKENDLEEEPQILIKNMDTIMEQCMYLSKTIDDFRNFIKDEKAKTNFTIVDAVEKAITIVSPSLISNRVQLVKDLKYDIEISGYENELIQSLINIINNAKDALIEHVENQSDRLIFVETRIENDRFIVKIQDSGGGIPEDILPHIFDTYFTTKPKEIGTGLGLSMAKKIITEHHHGQLTSQNSEYECKGKKYVGASFEIIFKI